MRQGMYSGYLVFVIVVSSLHLLLSKLSNQDFLLVHKAAK